MEICRRIKLGNEYYFIKLDCCYKTINNETMLCLKNYSNDYYDGGDLSILIKKIEEKYHRSNKYSDIGLLQDALYIYDNIPFISGVGDYYLATDNHFSTIGYITKEELDEYIRNNHIKMKDNSKFKLADERTWNVN